MIKTILWDFDGVILDSMRIKGDGFVELFKQYDLKCVKKIEKYHYQNGGVSRFDKIRYFYKKILKKNISDNEVLYLANKFAEIIKKKIYTKTNLIDDSIFFIKENFSRYDFHIVSGSEHKELNHLCSFFKIDKYFKSINGSPIKKEILVKNIIKKFNYSVNEIILVGDAITDYKAAKKNKIKFYGYNNISLTQYGNYVEKFINLKL